MNTVLGLDVGGANLKAATADKRAVSLPFALWKQPDALPAKLAELTSQFPDATEFAVTMTGELCDCYETKRIGVNAILDAVDFAAAGRRVRVWGTDGDWHGVDESRANPLLVAASNWHALATFAGRLVPSGAAVLVDIGSTTTDVIPIRDGVPIALGSTDVSRLASRELVYTGVRRTPACAILGPAFAAEFFATSLDAHLILGTIPEDAANTDTADGRPATCEKAHARLSRMLGGDPEVISTDGTRALSERMVQTQIAQIDDAVNRAVARLESREATLISSGSGEFLVGMLRREGTKPERLSLNAVLGPEVSACAPAYALAVLAGSRQN